MAKEDTLQRQAAIPQVAPAAAPPVVQQRLAAVPVPPIDAFDEAMRTPTVRERHLAELAELGKRVPPKLYDITSNHGTARRVIYDHNRRPITLTPGETKRGVLLHPEAAKDLRRPGGNLAVEDSAQHAQ